MAIAAPENSILRRFGRRIHISNSSGTGKRSVSHRIPVRLPGNDGGQFSTGNRQEMKEDIVRISTIKEKEKVKEWAYNNAYMLIFLSVMFCVTWVLFVLYAEGWIGKG